MCTARASRKTRIGGVGSPRVSIGWQSANRMTTTMPDGGRALGLGLTAEV
jgi:hypothetical protein